jgi:hypothetical protein
VTFLFAGPSIILRKRRAEEGYLRPSFSSGDSRASNRFSIAVGLPIYLASLVPLINAESFFDNSLRMSYTGDRKGRQLSTEVDNPSRPRLKPERF